MLGTIVTLCLLNQVAWMHTSVRCPLLVSLVCQLLLGSNFCAYYAWNNKVAVLTNMFTCALLRMHTFTCIITSTRNTTLFGPCNSTNLFALVRPHIYSAYWDSTFSSLLIVFLFNLLKGLFRCCYQCIPCVMHDLNSHRWH